MKLMQFYVDDIIKTALKEDVNYVDSTTDLLIDEESVSEAYFVSKADGVLAGLDVAMRVFGLLDDSIEVSVFFKDGDAIKIGDVIAQFKGGRGNGCVHCGYKKNPSGPSCASEIFRCGGRRQKSPL